MNEMHRTFLWVLQYHLVFPWPSDSVEIIGPRWRAADRLNRLRPKERQKPEHLLCVSHRRVIFHHWTASVACQFRGKGVGGGVTSASNNRGCLHTPDRRAAAAGTIWKHVRAITPVYVEIWGGVWVGGHTVTISVELSGNSATSHGLCEYLLMLKY